jgi:hypothetical protein
MSGTDYSLTPNLGLYKPNYALDVGQWGNHLNANADKLDAVVGGQVVSVRDFGADPTGAADSTTAFRDALATGDSVWAPAGAYLITGQLTVTGYPKSQELRGDGLSTVLLIDRRFDPTVTTGVIVLTGGASNGVRPAVTDLTIRFVQPNDVATTATVTAAAGTNTVTVGSAAGITVGMAVLNRTHTASIPSLTYFSAVTATTVTNITGNVLTLSANIVAPGVSSGDALQFATTRANFKTLAAGGSAGTLGQGIAYPWGIYCDTGQTILIRNVMMQMAWNGIRVRSSGFTIANVLMSALNVGMDIDQCFNFPSISDYRQYPWGSSAVGGPQDALLGTYYDGSMIAATIGETDGLAVNNFQSWGGQLNLTANWTWGSFTNVMMDGDNANFNVTSTRGVQGFVQISNFYSTKGTNTKGDPIYINTSNGFRVFINTFHLISSSPDYSGIVLVIGAALSISDGYLFNGITSTGPMVHVSDDSRLFLHNVALDAFPGHVNDYIVLDGASASATLSNCRFPTPPGAGGTGVRAVGVANGVYVDNISLNGWGISVPAGGKTNWLPATASYANDAAAATGGVAIGTEYRNGSAKMVRVA